MDGTSGRGRSESGTRRMQLGTEGTRTNGFPFCCCFLPFASWLRGRSTRTAGVLATRLGLLLASFFASIPLLPSRKPSPSDAERIKHSSLQPLSVFVLFFPPEKKSQIAVKKCVLCSSNHVHHLNRSPSYPSRVRVSATASPVDVVILIRRSRVNRFISAPNAPRLQRRRRRRLRRRWKHLSRSVPLERRPPPQQLLPHPAVPRREKGPRPTLKKADEKKKRRGEREEESEWDHRYHPVASPPKPSRKRVGRFWDEGEPSSPPGSAPSPLSPRRSSSLFRRANKLFQ